MAKAAKEYHHHDRAGPGGPSIRLRPGFHDPAGRRRRKPAGAAPPNHGLRADAGVEIEKVFVERGISGSKPLDDRPQGSALIGTLRPGDTVITAKLDRMFRSASNALEIMGAMKKAGISLHMLDLGGDVTGNGVSKLVFTILGRGC